MRLLAGLLLLASTTLSFSAETFFVTQAGAGSQDGTAIGDAWSVVNFENGGNWGAASGKIGAGDTVCFSGAITTEAIDIFGSGTDGTPISIDGKCDGITAATFTWAGNSNGININGDDYIHLNNITVADSEGRAIKITDSTGIVILSPDITVTNLKGIQISGTVGTVEVSGPDCTLTSNETWTDGNSKHGDAEGVTMDKGHTVTNLSVHGCEFVDWGHSAIKVNGNFTTVTVYENLFHYVANIPYGRAIGIFPQGGTDNGDYVYFFRNKLDGLRVASKILARNTFVYNNYITDITNRCFAADDTGCVLEYEVGGTDAQKEKNFATGRGWSIQSNNDTFIITENLVANNTFDGVNEQCFKNAVDPTEHTTISNSFFVINNVFLNCGRLNVFSDSPPGSNDSELDGKTSIQYDNWATDAGVFNNNSFFAEESDDMGAIDGTGDKYSVANINADAYVTNWSGDSNISTDPGITSGGFPDLITDNVVDAGATISAISDPHNVLPATGQISYGIDETSVWPDAVVTKQQEGTWDIGAFPFVNPVPPGITPVEDNFQWVICNDGTIRPLESCP